VATTLCALDVKLKTPDGAV